MTKTRFNQFAPRFALLLIPVLLLCECRRTVPAEEGRKAELTLYTSRDTFLADKNLHSTVPVPDRTIAVDSSLILEKKIRAMADSLSAYYFNGLSIELAGLDTIPEAGLVARIDLREKEEYSGPGSLPSYQSWYDFFQGSAGGTNTTITLRESFLQPGYEGSWINGVIFLYQGEPIGEWDHIRLQGLIRK
ncbi:MAG TPA: hypothetical protein ENN63_04880 [Bacteroidetes bacterium]|nr:hypothetical protein [Bacteroidota bacterium]